MKPIFCVGETLDERESGRTQEVLGRQVRDGLGPADDIRIQYGGSVSSGNIAMFMAQEHVDGALVGGASLDAKSVAMIVRY